MAWSQSDIRVSTFTPSDSGGDKRIQNPIYWIATKDRSGLILQNNFHTQLIYALNTAPIGTSNVYIYVCDGINVTPLYRWRFGKDIWQRINKKRVWILDVSKGIFKIVPGSVDVSQEYQILGEALFCDRTELKKLVQHINSPTIRRYASLGIIPDVEDDIPF